MSALLYLGGVLFVLVGIAVSIGLHELGHLYPAKKFGGKVTQYFVGFGRTVWSVRRGETEYGLKAIPLGGYVKIVGMLPPSAEDQARIERHAERRDPSPIEVRRTNTGLFTQLISDARAAEYERVEAGDEDRLFYRMAWWKKVIVMAGGPTVNLVLAFLLFGSVFMLYGVPTATRSVDRVYDCVIAVDPTDPTTQRTCTPADPPSPAADAGLRPGDRIVAFNGTPIDDWEQLTNLIRANGDGSAVLVVERGGQRLTLTTNTTVNAVLDTEDQTRTVQAGYLGVSPEVVRETQGPGFVVAQMADYTWRTIQALAQLPVKLWGVAKALAGVQERDPDSPMSVVGASRVAGEISSQSDVAALDRFMALVMLLAGINLFVGVFNLVPLLPLDGGHIAGALIEAVRRGWARLRRRPDPGFFDVAKQLPVAYVMAGVLLVMSVLLITADLVVPVRLGG